jgi:hypothetical protein
MSQARLQVSFTRDTLTGLQDWCLPQVTWERIGGLLGQLEAALDRRDLGEVSRLMNALLLNAPRRVSDPESAEADDNMLPPEAIRDQLNQLIHAIDMGWPNVSQSADDDSIDD